MKNTVYFVVLIVALVFALGITPKTERTLQVIFAGCLGWTGFVAMVYGLRGLYRFITR